MSDAPPLPWAGRLVGWCLRLVAAVTATSLLLAAVILAGLLPAARWAGRPSTPRGGRRG